MSTTVAILCFNPWRKSSTFAVTKTNHSALIFMLLSLFEFFLEVIAVHEVLESSFTFIIYHAHKTYKPSPIFYIVFL